MVNYVGSKCIVCNHGFSENDDIVVCPECGTPYHRECYKENDCCINTELHEKNQSWKPEIKEENAEIICPKCKKSNPALTLFCENCGSPITVVTQKEQYEQYHNHEKTPEQPSGDEFVNQFLSVNFGDPLCGLNPEEQFEDANVSEIADYVGSNTYYFLPMFKIMKEKKIKITWNLPALIFPELYYGYRKMYWPMFLMLFIKFILSIPQMIMLLGAEELSGNILYELFKNFPVDNPAFILYGNMTVFISYAVIIVTAIFSNWFYYRYTLNSIKKIKAKINYSPNPTNEDKEHLKTALKARGGVSRAIPLTLVTLLFITVFFITMTIK